MVQKKGPSEYAAIQIQIASPETILSWSFGEVTKPETINYRSFRPERDGLFCERIFGPVKDWECSCGKYKRIRFRGIVCDRCGVEVTQSKVRRERMGHIELAVPVSHIWYFRSLPSRIGHMMNLSIRELERILYYEKFLMIDPGNSSYQEGDVLTEEEHLELQEAGKNFDARMGAEAVREVLSRMDIDELAIELHAQAKVETSVQRKKDVLKRLRIIESFRQSNNRPEWMVLKVLPVIPPDLRPLVPLDGGRFATSDLNDLYRRVINRNNRLKKLIDIQAPEVILRNEKRMLQESVDALLDNGRRTHSVRGDSKRPLKSLSDLMKGKQGRFRQNLLGKRVDYSGRSVIVVGPELKLHQCGLPKNMALELFKPFIIMKLEEKGYVQTVKSAKKLVEREKPEVWDILEEIIEDHPIMLNRAPTLHRLGIQAFYPVLVEGKAIRLHPLVCSAFNADFDGDQMAVHLPLSFEAQTEARILMMASNNLLLPSSGRPVTVPSQDMVIGCYYLTQKKAGVMGEGMSFYSPDEVLAAYDSGNVDLHAMIGVRIDHEMIKTTPGRLIFNNIFPDGVPFINEVTKKKELEEIISQMILQFDQSITVDALDRLKHVGFEYATKAGVTVSIDDLVVPNEKDKLLAQTEEDVKKIQKRYERGVITNGERYNQVIDKWTRTTADIANVMFDNLALDQGGFNPVYMMADSGARGSREQIRQLTGIRGLMAKPQKKITGGVGEIIENPITSNFRAGLTVQEYFISTHGARKGLADTALKTADAGYLTRRLVDVAQDVIIRDIDCGTIRGIEVSAIKEGEEIIVSLYDRILGRVTLEDIYNPITDEVIVKAGDQIEEKEAEIIEDAGIETVNIRSVLTCESKFGVCAKCYGRDLATMKTVNIGEAVGVVAAQSIGEPGTQLTLRTFHIGGTAARIAEQSQVEAKFDCVALLKQIKSIERDDGTAMVTSREGVGEVHLQDENNRVRAKLKVPYGAHLLVKEGQAVKRGDIIFEWDPYTGTILAEKSGKVKFKDIIKDVSLREAHDEQTGLIQSVIIETKDKTIFPTVMIRKGNKTVESFRIPTDAQLQVSDGQSIEAGDILVKMPRVISKSRDITGGLPRVAELFESRRPHDPAVISEVDGEVELGKTIRGHQQIIVKEEHDETSEYLIPHGKHLMVHSGDHVLAGDRLCEGAIDPHDILNIMGVYEAQSYLVNEIQEVYRLQGVKINDKHIEVIVRQMMQKVQIESIGETNFLEGEKVDISKFSEENARVIAEGGDPATSRPLLLGITRASLSTESFISAASFQETTKILTEAAISGKVDYLLGLKENVIIGHLIPAGTGVDKYKSIEVVVEEEKEEEEEGKEEEVGTGVDENIVGDNKPKTIADIFDKNA
ncbi:MAG: DNA-directed RNA polymerase subunit beta' [candidate division Zixibacteria bacterium]|nr:DNA-directed RNA polymerase subunit beta' [candidate division Zixibacteria bacterium]